MALLWAHLLGEEPQWSPPLDGREQLRRLQTVCCSVTCRTGARRRTAGAPAAMGPQVDDTLAPQWSPPMDGGSTRF